MIKTFREQFDIMSLEDDKSKLDDIIVYKKTIFDKTKEHEIQEKVIESLIESIKNLKGKKSDNNFDKLNDEIYTMEEICYDGGYRKGIEDLLTALTFNKASITDPEFIPVK